ncbi:MAG: FAD-dependent oxidoreductase [Candidatus Jorgensenbacteria bacterium]|nr:FAD-dependent oxidoreductase [Candidatus Jorgensenbacteria bacterium]
MLYDLIIIGGGPAGVAAAVYAARKKLKTAIVADTFGGQSLVSASVENWIGIPKISGFDLAETFKAHLKAQEGLDVKEGERVKKIEAYEGGFRVATEQGDGYETKTILVATGSVRRKLGVSGERELEGRGVAYCSICDAPLFKDKNVAVVGGGNSGLEAVEDLLPYARGITLLHRGAALKGDPQTQEKVLADKEKVRVLLNAETTAILGEKWVTGLRYRDTTSGAEQELPVEGVFVAVGLDPNSALVKDLVEVNERGEIVTDPMTQATSRRGIWAAGDATDGKYRQNNISAGDAVKAVLHIYETFRMPGTTTARTVP